MINLFNIPNAEQCICRVFLYIHSHSQLAIQVYDSISTSVLYIVFQTVEYVDGPIVWLGANFMIGEPDECIKLLRISHGHRNSADHALRERYRLFSAGVDSDIISVRTFRIVAARGDVIEQGEFKKLNLFAV